MWDALALAPASHKRHISLPLALQSSRCCDIAGAASTVLMLGFARLRGAAAFALPTLQRGPVAAIDWFSVFFFSIAALAIWVI